jgi:hypothetical protein
MTYILGKLDIDTKALVLSAIETKKQIDELIARQEKLKEVGRENSVEFLATATALKNLSSAYAVQQTAIAAQATEEGKLLSIKKAIKGAVNEVNKSENDYLNNNRQLIELKKNLNSTDDDYEKRLGKINAKLQENNSWLKENGSANGKLITTMNDYKDQVKEGFNSINIFNGGLSGLISRAQEAGGTGPLLKGAFDSMSQGIMGMTRSAISFIATPIGATLAIIAGLFALVQNAMNNSTESAGKITKVFTTFSVITDALLDLLTPLGEVLVDGIAAGFELAGKAAEAAMGFISGGLKFLGFDEAAQGVTEFTAEVKRTAEETISLKKAQGELATQMAVQEVNNEKAKQQAEELIKVSQNQKLSEEERIKALTAASAIENTAMGQRKKLNDESYHQTVRSIAVGKNLTAEELTGLNIQGAAYAQKLMKVKGFTQEEIDTLQKAQVEKMRLSGEEVKMFEDQEAAKQKIRDDAEQKRQQAEEARKAKVKEALDKEVERQTLALNLLVEQQGVKAKTLKEELTLAEKVADGKKKLAQAEFAASDGLANAKLKKQIADAKTTNDLTRAQAAVAVENADRELKNYISTHSEKLKGSKLLNDELYKQEVTRLQDIQKKEVEFQLAKLNAGVISQQQYIDAITAINKAAEKSQDTLREERESAEKVKQAADLANKRAVDTVNHDYDLQFQLKAFDDTYAQEKKAAEDSGADMELFEEARAKRRKDIEESVFNNKLSLASSTFSSLQGILGKESAAGKAMAVAQATIDTYKSAVAAYSSMSGIPIVGPALGAVAAGAAVAAGIANVKKITATKTPKAEKGALFNLGGNRHSNGGTLFTGADGTRFEAEQGELIGVMNRNAAAHFMAFNNAFPAGGSSAPNYFAGGGIVSREIASPSLNIDELAAKIALANSAIPAPVVAVQDIVAQGNSYVQVRDAANF